MGKDNRINFRCDSEELNKIKSKASQIHMSLSEYIRTSCLYAGCLYIDYRSLESVSYELAKIGNNINQIARDLNIMRIEGEAIDGAQLHDELKSIHDLLSNIDNIVANMYKQSKYIHYTNASEYLNTEGGHEDGKY